MSLRKISLMGPSCLHIEFSFGNPWNPWGHRSTRQDVDWQLFRLGTVIHREEKGDLSNKNGGPMGSEWVNNWGDVGRHVCMLRYAKEDSPNIKHIHRIIYSKWKTNRGKPLYTVCICQMIGRKMRRTLKTNVHNSS